MKHGFPRLVKGRVRESFTYKELISFVLDKRPSLKGKPIEIAIARQPVY